MAAEGELSTFFPVPPPFFKSFTKSNRESISEFSKTLDTPNEQEGQSKTDATITQTLSDLPSEVRHLIPPRPPADGIHKSFNAELGGPQPTLTSMGAEQLLPPTSAPVTSSDWTTTRSAHLKSLTQSIMLNFLELLGTLSVHPEGHAADKIADLEVLFLNAHNVINEYRPHQARDELIRTMRRKVEGLEEEIAGVHRMKEQTDELLKELSQAGDLNDINGEGVNGIHGQHGRITAQRKDDDTLWSTLIDEVTT